jgi:hypothetical protein
MRCLFVVAGTEARDIEEVFIPYPSSLKARLETRDGRGILQIGRLVHLRSKARKPRM